MKISILGDSIAAGLGVRGKSYSDLICCQLEQNHDDVEVYNYASSAMQLVDSRRFISTIVDNKCDLIIIAHGITEAIVRPKDKLLKFMPKRWRRAGWMDPRPYFSKKKLRRLGQKIESSIRWRIKVFLVNLAGGITWGSRMQFKKNLNLLINEVLQDNISQVLLLSHTGIDEKYFPGSLTSLNDYKNDIFDLVEKFNTDRVKMLDISNICDEWGDYLDDNFHPNKEGHRKIADLILLHLNNNQQSIT